ncbi:MAG: tRNA lysidine(34) synthetase TilS [Longimicrobiales bacterium]
MTPRSLEARFGASLAGAGSAADGRWVVAVSGGLDSVVLLHLLRFGVEARSKLVVAHFDHAMRPESVEDGHWVEGLARSWGLEVRVGRALHPPSTEAEAREARYGFLDEVRRELGASLVLTAHHADDQAETVLFRALRGAGRAGLAGMAVRRDFLLRPLLGIWREELEAYAQAHRLSWRVDDTNASMAYARNALRHRVIPDIERLVAPGARRALVRLADLAREDESAWRSVLPFLLAPLHLEEEGGALTANRAALLTLEPPVRARVLRALVARMGGSLDESATRRAVGFVAVGGSGQSIDLGRGLTLRRDLDRLAISAPVPAARDRPLSIPDRGPGFGEAFLAGRDVHVTWGAVVEPRGHLTAAFDAERLRFPLRVRAREAGDRIRLARGPDHVTKKVKKLLLEHRIPVAQRDRLPLVVDAAGEVLWIPGVAHAAHATAAGGSLTIVVG